MKILIITGGSSSERKISLRSAAMVKEALARNGHAVKLFDFKKGFVGLEKELPNFDIVFPVMHGKEGEDGVLYGWLKKRRKPYVGSDPKGAKIAFNKVLFKKYCVANKIPTARWREVKNVRDVEKFGLPCVLKAAEGGSSQEVVILKTRTDLSRREVRKIFKLGGKVFVEELILGVEITVGILLDKALPIVEIVPPEGKWFDYKNKYSGGTKEVPFAPSVPKRLQNIAQKIALGIHCNLNLGSYSRTDIIIKDGIPYVLEVNTPGGVGLTRESLLPKAAGAAGIEFEKLVEKMLPKKK